MVIKCISKALGILLNRYCKVATDVRNICFKEYWVSVYIGEGVMMWTTNATVFKQQIYGLGLAKETNNVKVW